MINEHRTEEWYTPEYRASHMAGLYGLRVADQVRLEHGNEQVGAVYTMLGEAIHLHGMKQEISTEPVATIQGLLKSIGLSPGLADAALDESHDAYIRGRHRSCVRTDRQGRRNADHHLSSGAGQRVQLLRAGDRLDPAW